MFNHTITKQIRIKIVNYIKQQKLEMFGNRRRFAEIEGNE